MDLFQKIVGHEDFQSAYLKLKIDSYSKIAKSFSQDYNVAVPITDDEISYLLRVASLLLNSPDEAHTNIASRISNHLIELPTSSKEVRAACAYILNQLTINQSVDLAKKNGLIDSEIERLMPANLQLDLIKNDLIYSFLFAGKNLPINTFQKKVMDQFFSKKSVFISAPTSAGKSYILLRLLISELIVSQKKISCFVVPTRALVKQVQEDILSILVDNNIRDIYVTSVPKMPELNFLDNRKMIFVLTQERLAWLLTTVTQTLDLERLVVDEIHKIGDGARGLILETTIKAAYLENRNVKIAFSGPNIESFEELTSVFDNITEINVAKSESTYIPQNLLTIDSVYMKPKEILLSLYVEGKKIREEQIDIYGNGNRTERAASIVYSIAEEHDGGSIVYVNLPSVAEEVALELAAKCKKKDNEKIRNLDEVVKTSVHPDYLLRSTITSGVGFHYGNMPSLLREELETQFKNGTLKYLVCTSTLVEGVNLNAKNVFVLTPKRNNTINLSGGDFWNLAGRAGRLGSSFEGNVICVRSTHKWNYDLPIDKRKTQIHFASKVDNQTVETIIKRFRSERITSKHDKNYLDNLISYYFDLFLTDKDFDIKDVKNNLVSKLKQEFVNFLHFNELPTEIYQDNFGINPVHIHSLYEHFNSKLPPEPQIIPLPLDDMELARAQSFEPIIATISRFLSKEGEGLTLINSRLVVSWASGEPLPKVINHQIKYWTSKARGTKRKTKDATIRHTLERIEQYVRFEFLKYSRCYFDILKYVLNEKDMAELAGKIPDISLWLEFGSNKDLEILLMSMGFSRNAAIFVSKVFPSDRSYDLAACIEFLKVIKWNELEMSARVREDIERVMNYLDTL